MHRRCTGLEGCVFTALDPKGTTRPLHKGRVRRRVSRKGNSLCCPPLFPCTREEEVVYSYPVPCTREEPSAGHPQGLCIEDATGRGHPQGLCIFLPCAFPSIRDERRGKDDTTGRGHPLFPCKGGCEYSGLALVPFGCILSLSRGKHREVKRG